MPTTKIRSTSTSAAHEVDSTRAWVVVASAFLAMFTVFGVAYSFGEFFGPMADEFGTSRSATALFFSITTFAYFAIGIISGRIADRIGPRRVMIFGAVAMVTGLLLTAEVSSIRLGYLTYGLGVGIGGCLLLRAHGRPLSAAGSSSDAHSPSASLSQASDSERSSWFPSSSESSKPTVGATRTRVLAAVSGVLLVIRRDRSASASRLSRLPPDRSARSSVDRPDFWFLYASSLFLAAALFTPFVFMADYIDTTETSGSAACSSGSLAWRRSSAAWDSVRSPAEWESLGSTDCHRWASG